MRRIAAAAMLAALVPACSGGGSTGAGSPDAGSPDAARLVALTITGARGVHRFRVERAKTAAEQERGLMFRSALPADGGMLFAPYPPEGGGPRQAIFWMKNTPSPLDIVFIRPDRTIARIAENTVPFSEAPIPSGEPVAAVLELNAGRAAALGLSEGDRVAWAD